MGNPGKESGDAAAGRGAGAGPGSGPLAIPRVIAHRGASRDRPENTLPAFDEALRQGCDAIELDLQLSRDGVPVVYHDETLARVGLPGEAIAQHPLERLRQLDVGMRSGDEHRNLRIPTFQEVLERYAARTRLLVEIKIWGTPEHRVALLEAAVDLVKRQAAEERIFVLCYDHEVLEACAKIAPRLPRALNLRPNVHFGSDLASRVPTCQIVSADVRGLTPRFGAAVRRAGHPLIVFSCNTPDQVDAALRAGAAGIMSDRPAWLAARIRPESIGP